MKIEKTICDRCKKEIEPIDTIAMHAELRGYTFERPKIGGRAQSEYDICENCTRDFDAWILAGTNDAAR